MTHPIDSTPTTPQEWRQRAIQHYQKSRAMMARYERREREAGQADRAVERAYRIAANETQAAIAAGIIADAGFNEYLATPTEPIRLEF